MRSLVLRASALAATLALTLGMVSMVSAQTTSVGGSTSGVLTLTITDNAQVLTGLDAFGTQPSNSDRLNCGFDGNGTTFIARADDIVSVLSTSKFEVDMTIDSATTPEENRLGVRTSDDGGLACAQYNDSLINRNVFFINGSNAGIQTEEYLQGGASAGPSDPTEYFQTYGIRVETEDTLGAYSATLSFTIQAVP